MERPGRKRSASLSQAVSSISRPIEILNRTDDTILIAAHRLKELQQVYQENSDAIKTILASKAFSNADTHILHALSALDALQGIHPFVAIGVIAIKTVVKMELKRRANDRRIITVHYAILDMASALFELSKITKPELRDESEGPSREDRLTTCLRDAETEIEKAGNSIDKYNKTQFLIKFCRSSHWQEKLTGHVKNFTTLKMRIHESLAIHTAAELEEVRRGIDTMTKLLVDTLKRFANADEEDLEKKVKGMGGIQSVMKDENQMLLLARDKDNKNGSGSDEQVKRRLKLELETPLDDLLKENEAIFTKKFKSLANEIKMEIDRVIDAVLKGPHERVDDPDLKVLWEEEKWQGSVKARHLVLSLHDYFSTPKVRRGDTTPSPAQQLTYMTPNHRDYWTLNFMTTSFTPAIQDALDDDGSGFISIKEINEFTSSTPDYMSLPLWIAYWAGGWAIVCEQYKYKIHSLIRRMHRTAENALEDNKFDIEYYMESGLLEDVQGLTTRGARKENAKLWELAENHRKEMETKLRETLQDVKFEIDGLQALSAICGPGRIDKYLLVIVYLLLERHLEIMDLCNEYILDPRELDLAQTSLYCVIHQVGRRIRHLRECFRQQHFNVDSSFRFFCNGLYETLYTRWFEDEEDSYDYSSEEDESETSEEETDEENDSEIEQDSARIPEGTTTLDTGESEEPEQTQSVEAENNTLDERVLPFTSSRTETGLNRAESIRLLRYRPRRAGQEVIGAHKAKLAEQSVTKADAKGAYSGAGAGKSGPRGSLESRLKALEKQMDGMRKDIQTLLDHLVKPSAEQETPTVPVK